MEKPLQVPSKLKQTFPFAYKFGLNLTVALAVVTKVTKGGFAGKF